MFGFEFYNPTRIIFGKEKLDKIDRYIPKEAKVLITYGGGSAQKTGLLDRVKAALGDRTVLEFGGIEPNPQYTTLVKAIDLVKAESIDFLLAVGGGSVIDGTKFISLAALYEGESHLLLQPSKENAPAKKAVPFGVVVTLPATGSEMNNGAVISYEHGKYPVFHPLLYPKFSVIDPTLTFSLPARQVANGVVDAFVHVMEQYLTFPVDARVQDRMSEGILLTLVEVGNDSVNEPENYDVRANHVFSATMALNGLIGSGVPQDWSSHMIGHELTALFGIDHGQTLAVLLPSVMEERRTQKHAKLLQYGERIWGITQGNEEERIDLAIEKTRSFFESLGVKTKLSDYGVKAEQIEDVVNQLIAHGMTALSETRDLSPEIARKILERSL